MKILALLFAVNSFANSIYIWSKEFNTQNNKNIISFLKKNHINNALVSVSKNINLNKLNDFLKYDIKVEFLIGDNSWIYPSKWYKVDEKFKILNSFNNYYIHLDIEPHVIKELKSKREKYLRMYIDMIKYIKTKYPKYHISISIPTFYYIEYVEKMDKYVDKIYLMAYEYKKLSQLQKRVEKFEKFRSKIVVVFNCKDYKTYKQLQKDVMFIKKLGYKEIAFHSFSSLKELYETK